MSPNDEVVPDAVAWLDRSGQWRTIRMIAITDRLKMCEFVEQQQTAFEHGADAFCAVDLRDARVHLFPTQWIVRVLSRAELNEDAVLPGFRLPLADLFPPPDAPV